MLPLCRSFIRPHRVMLIVTAESRRHLLLTSKLCERATEGLVRVTRAPRDLLKSSILSTKSTQQMEAVVEQHLSVMDHTHLVLSMKHFMHLAKEEEAGEALPGKPSFQMLSTSFLSKIRFLSADDCLKMAGGVSMVKLDCSCALVQGIYQMLRQRLNELDIEQIIYLQRCLGQLKGSSPLTDALKTSVPMVFETQIARQLDTRNGAACLRALRFALTNNIRSDIQNFVAKASHKYLPTADTSYATDLIYGVAFNARGGRILLGNEARKVVRQCLQIVAKDLSEMDAKSIRRLMAAYAVLNIRQPELDDALWKSAPSWSFQEIMVLTALAVSTDALSHEHGLILKNILLARKSKLSTEANLLQVLNSADCLATLAVQSRTQVKGLNELGHQLALVLEREKNTFREKPAQLVHFMLDLAILGVHPERELEWLFSDEFAKMAVSELPLANLHRLLDLERLLGDHLGPTSPYLIASEIKEKVESSRLPMNIDDSLVLSLQQALGGEEYLLERVMTPLGVVADLMVVLNKDKHPIVLANKPDPLHDLPKNSDVVSILQCKPSRDLNWRRMLKVPFALRDRFLRKQGIRTVSVRVDDWQQITSRERIPLIMKWIKGALKHRIDRELQPNDQKPHQKSL